MGVPADFYRITNESLDSIVGGLSPALDDRILAICGSGDQALALLEYAGYVLAVDNNPAQIDYALKRIELVRLGLFERFLHLPAIQRRSGLDSRYEYFSMPGRLSRIRERLGRLDVRNCDLTGALTSEFTKVYLSNVPGYSPGEFFRDPFKSREETYPGIVSLFKRIASALPIGGLVYAANGDDIDKVRSHCTTWPSELKVDPFFSLEALWGKALKGNSWRPVVYKKTLLS